MSGMQNARAEKVMICKNCDKFFGYSERQTRCPFCKTGDIGVDEEKAEETVPTPAKGTDAPSDVKEKEAARDGEGESAKADQ